MIQITHTPRFMVVGLVSSREPKEKMVADFEELESLIHTYGTNVYAVAVQNSTRFDNDTFIGRGKAEEVAATITKENIDVLVVNANVKPRQLFALKAILEKGNPKIGVWDRVDLILEIFQKHAVSKEAKLQISLASIRHMGPRIYGTGMELSQQGGGIGTRGIGETNTERMRRHWQNEKRVILGHIKKLTEDRERQMEQRKKNGSPTISIVGYTNAGKTSLFNALAKEHNHAEDTLFATLDSSVGKMYLPILGREVFITDTIGFIQNLPPQLIDAFKSTLLETIHADLIAHVIDASDPRMAEKIDVVETILQSLNIEAKSMVYVFNKIDKATGLDKKALTEKYASSHPQFVSVTQSEGIKELVKTIENLLSS